jgi:Zc3h12a-like Ribonuclease NYN domain
LISPISTPTNIHAVGFPAVILVGQMLTRSRAIYPNREVSMKDRAVIDASNMLRLKTPTQRKPSVNIIYAVIDAVRASGREPILVLDPATLSTVADPENIETLLAESFVLSVSAGTDVNRAVLETAERRDAIVVSNNTYSDYWAEYSWVELCRLPVAIVDGDVCLLEQRFRNVS